MITGCMNLQFWLKSNHEETLVIFGTSDIAELAHFYFSKDSEYEIVAFTIDRPFISADQFCGLPVIAFEDIAENFPADKNEMFIALSYARINQTRKDKYLAPKRWAIRLQAMSVQMRPC